MKIHWFSYLLEKWGFFRRSLGILLAVSMLFNMLPQSRALASALSDTKAEDIESAFGDGSLTYTLSDTDGDGAYDKIEIGGNGRMPNWMFESSVPWYSYRETLKTVEIGGGVTHIGNYAFGIAFKKLETLAIPEGVASIGDKAFYSCASLKSVRLPASIDTIGKAAFSWCGGLTTISVPRHFDCDNACIEAFHSLIKREWLNRFQIQDYDHAYRLVFEYIETFYNTVRIHSHCDYMSPNDFEKLYEKVAS